MQKKSKVKTIVIVILAIILVVESGALIFSKNSSAEVNDDPVQVVDGGKGEIDTSEVTIQEDIVLQSDPDSILKKVLGDKDIGEMLRSVIYTNAIPSAAMKAVYPTLYKEAKDMLELANGINLYATGPMLAAQMGDVDYTAVDKDGVRKPLTDVLEKVGEKWKYLDTMVTWTDENGVEKETSIYNSIDWKVHDADSFYQAMNDCALGFRGLLEVTVQSKRGSIELAKAAAILANVDMLESVVGLLMKIPGVSELKYAATVYNPNEMSGYQAFFVYLFNCLGLVDGEYPSDNEVRNYATMGELFKALIESIVYGVEKLMKDPGQNVANLLMNLVDAIDSGKFVQRFNMCDMYLEYHPLLEKLGVGKSNTLFNLGKTVLDMVRDANINIDGNWNELLQSVIKMIGGSNAKLPAFNTAKFLALGKTRTLPNGNKVYTANANQAYGFFVDYLMQGQVLEVILNKVGLFGKSDISKIVAAFNAADDGISNLLKVVLAAVLNNLV